MSGNSHDGAAAGRLVDTNAAASRRYLELLRLRSPHERLAQAMALTRATRELAVAGIKQRCPDAGPGEVRRHLATLLYGRSVADRIFTADLASRT